MKKKRPPLPISDTYTKQRNWATYHLIYTLTNNFLKMLIKSAWIGDFVTLKLIIMKSSALYVTKLERYDQSS